MGEQVDRKTFVDDAVYVLGAIEDSITHLVAEADTLSDKLTELKSNFHAITKMFQEMHNALTESERARKVAEEVALNKKVAQAQVEDEEEDPYEDFSEIDAENIFQIEEGHKVVTTRGECLVKYVSTHKSIVEKFFVLELGTEEFFMTADELLEDGRIDDRQFDGF